MNKIINNKKENEYTENDVLLVIHMLNEYYKGHDMIDKIISKDAMFNIIEGLKKDGIIEE